MEDKTNKPEEQGGWCLIPPHIMANEELSANEKIIYGKILGLSKKRGYCYAWNAYIAKSTGLSSGTVSNIISKMHRKKIIHRKTIRDPKNKQVIERRLYTLISEEVLGEEWGGSHDTEGTPINGRVEKSIRSKRKDIRRDTSSSAGESSFANYKHVYEEVIGRTCRAFRSSERKKLAELEADFGKDRSLELWQHFLKNADVFIAGAGSKSVDWFHHKFDAVQDHRERGSSDAMILQKLREGASRDSDEVREFQALVEAYKEKEEQNDE